MLKLIYTENSLLMEVITQSLEDWVQMRVILALRVADTINLEPTTASFLLPKNLTNLSLLQAEVQGLYSHLIGLDVVDNDYVEVSLDGTWISGENEDEGVFVTSLPWALELFLLQLWSDSLTVNKHQYI